MIGKNTPKYFKKGTFGEQNTTKKGLPEKTGSP